MVKCTLPHARRGRGTRARAAALLGSLLCTGMRSDPSDENLNIRADCKSSCAAVRYINVALTQGNHYRRPLRPQRTCARDSNGNKRRQRVEENFGMPCIALAAFAKRPRIVRGIGSLAVSNYVLGSREVVK